MRFTLKQKGEYEKLQELLKFGGHKKWGSLSKPNQKQISVLQVDSQITLRYLISYLENFPLHSIKNIAYVKWLKLFRVIEDGGRGKDYETIKQMARSINKYEVEDKVHDLEKY